MLCCAGIRLAEDAASFDHSFEPGTISVVLGRNRSGKTRLCRMLAGLEPLQPGSAGEASMQLDGEEIGQLPPGERPVALVYQSFVNYPNLTVAENIASPLRAAGVPRKQRRARVGELAQQLGIVELLERFPEQLSGGQQQRVAIARALAKRARLLVLDEPLVNLDFKLREAFEDELRGLLRREDLIVIYTTSDPRDAFNLADEVLLLDQHELLQAGEPVDVYRRPSCAAAADLMSDPGINCWRRDEVLHGVRPEHLSLVAESADDLAFAAELLSLETNGSQTYLHCLLHEDDDRAEARHWVARLEGLVAGEDAPAVGERVQLFAMADAVLRFPDEVRRG